jgi:phosphoserine phosphatase
MPAPQNTIAIIFDFDDTLTDDSTTRLLEAHGIDAVDFWQNQNSKLVEDGWSPTMSYLKLLLDNVGEGKPLGRLSNAGLREFGSSLTFYDGIPGLFTDLKTAVKEHKHSNPSIEFYIVSGGLEEVIKGSSIAEYMDGIWGCQFAEENGVVAHVKRPITFTEKTKYLFEINKGFNLNSPEPYAVNQYVAKPDRRIPMENMIYLGDGLTDVPCFSLLNLFNGKGFGIFDPSKKGSPKKGWEQLVVPHRVYTLNSPKYGENHDLGSLLRAAVKEICLRMDVRTQQAYSL